MLNVLKSLFLQFKWFNLKLNEVDLNYRFNPLPFEYSPTNGLSPRIKTTGELIQSMHQCARARTLIGLDALTSSRLFTSF